MCYLLKEAPLKAFIPWRTHSKRFNILSTSKVFPQFGLIIWKKLFQWNEADESHHLHFNHMLRNELCVFTVGDVEESMPAPPGSAQEGRVLSDSSGLTAQKKAAKRCGLVAPVRVGRGQFSVQNICPLIWKEGFLFCPPGSFTECLSFFAWVQTNKFILNCTNLIWALDRCNQSTFFLTFWLNKTISALAQRLMDWMLAVKQTIGESIIYCYSWSSIWGSTLFFSCTSIFVLLIHRLGILLQPFPIGFLWNSL